MMVLCWRVGMRCTSEVFSLSGKACGQRVEGWRGFGLRVGQQSSLERYAHCSVVEDAVRAGGRADSFHSTRSASSSWSGRYGENLGEVVAHGVTAAVTLIVGIRCGQALCEQARVLVVRRAGWLHTDCGRETAPAHPDQRYRQDAACRERACH